MTVRQTSGDSVREDGRRQAPVTDRVNVEPSILNGMTVTEAQLIAAVAFVIFLVIGGIVFMVTNYWHALFLLAVFGPVVVLWFASLYLQKIKRGRPDAYYSQAIHLWMSERNLAKPKFIRHEGYWDLGRSLDLSLASPLEPTEEAPAAAPLPSTPSSPTEETAHERT